MNTFEFAVINEYNRVKLLNECEKLSEKQLDIINTCCDSAWAELSENDFKNILSENEENTLYTDIKNAVQNVLNEYNLSFSDSRCYYYLIDGLYELLEHRF